MVKTIFYSLAALVRKILFSPREDKIHIFAPPCNIFYISVHMQAALLIHYDNAKTNEVNDLLKVIIILLVSGTKFRTCVF